MSRTLIDTTLTGNFTAWRDSSGLKVTFRGEDGRGRQREAASLEAVLHEIMQNADIASAHVEMSIRLIAPSAQPA